MASTTTVYRTEDGKYRMQEGGQISVQELLNFKNPRVLDYHTSRSVTNEALLNAVYAKASRNPKFRKKIIDAAFRK